VDRSHLHMAIDLIQLNVRMTLATSSLVNSKSGPPCSSGWANTPVCGQQFPEYVRTSYVEDGGAWTARRNYNQGLRAPVYQFTASQHPLFAQSARLEFQPLQEDASGQSVAQACMFAGIITGLKAESNGSNMPSASVLTPIDGLGPVDEFFFSAEQSSKNSKTDYPLAFNLQKNLLRLYRPRLHTAVIVTEASGKIWATSAP
jgi:hypothetical protein